MKAVALVSFASLVALAALAAVGCASTTDSAKNSEAALEGAEVDTTFPAVGLLQSAKGELATGTLVAPNVVLTMANDFAPDDRVAAFYTGPGVPTALGADPAPALAAMTKHDVAEAVLHPTATTDVDWNQMFNIQLVRLAAPISDVRPIALARAAIPEGATCTLVSFGAYTESGSLVAYSRRSGEMKMGAATEFLFEAQEGPAWPSAGDAAAPFVCDGVIAGLYSYDEGVSGSSAPPAHFFNRVDSINAWIQGVLQGWK